MVLKREQSASRVRMLPGFSLAELTVVLVITGILAAIAVPRFGNSLALRRTEGAARRIVTDLAMAQRYATAGSVSQTVRFFPVFDKYAIVGMPDRDHPLAEYAVSLAKEPYRVHLTSANFGGDAAIIFDAFGVPDSGGSAIIQSGSLTRTITVDPDTGKAAIQ